MSDIATPDDPVSRVAAALDALPSDVLGCPMYDPDFRIMARAAVRAIDLAAEHPDSDSPLTTALMTTLMRFDLPAERALLLARRWCRDARYEIAIAQAARTSK